MKFKYKWIVPEMECVKTLQYEGCSISSWPNIEGKTVAPTFYYYI